MPAPCKAPSDSPMAVPFTATPAVPIEAPSVPPSRAPSRAERQQIAANKLEQLRSAIAKGRPSRPLSPTSVCWLPREARSSLVDDLDDIVSQSAAQYEVSSSLEDLVHKVRDPRGDFHPRVGQIGHPASHLLNRLRCIGAPVICKGNPWSFAQKSIAL
jgi:hypothetical protein